MITKVSLTNFKCFEEKTDFDLSKINLFTGLNGRGKSTVLQALLLLAQSVNKNGNIENLYVNGKYVSLDLFEDIVNFNSETNKSVTFGINTDNVTIQKLIISYQEQTDRVGNISEMKVNDKDYFQKGESLSGSKTDNDGNESSRYLYSYPKQDINDLFCNYYFISANRLGPTRDESKADEYDLNPVGVFGEHRLNILSKSTPINSVNFDQNKGCLLDETNKWLSYIMDGASIDVLGKEKENSVLQLTLCNNTNCDKKVKAINFGFGYSYILSIIITSLIAQPGYTVFIENPEAHLHPRAQSRLTELLCKLAESGVQVFVETHSEHVINSVRLCSLKDNFSLTNEDVSMYFFSEDFKSEKLIMDKEAQISNWPDGFFDQQEKDLSQILKLGLFK